MTAKSLAPQMVYPSSPANSGLILAAETFAKCRPMVLDHAIVAAPGSQVSIDAQRKYVEIKGAWFVVRFEPFEAGSSPFDAVLSTKHERSEIERGRYAKTPKKKHVPDYFYTGQWGAAIYAVEKRQISAAEIRKLKRAGVLPV